MSLEKSTLKERLNGLSFSFRIARRYLFSKKSHNAINVISAISATGVAIGTMALVVVLSVFNGFESLIADMFSAFDPDLKISLVEGKSFEINNKQFSEIKKNKSVAVFAEVIEENALVRFRDKQMPARIKGVSDNFKQLTDIDSIIVDGDFMLFDGAFERTIPGIGVATIIGAGAHFIDPLYIYAPKRTSNINLLNPSSSFNESATFISGIFSVKQNQYDDQYVLVSLNLARELFEYSPHTVTSVEIKLKNGVNQEKVKEEIKKVLGSGFNVHDRFEQQESFYKILKLEKWMTFLILSFIVLIASFNIIGSLSMLIIDKKEDIVTLRNLGAREKLIRQIFVFEGWMISVLGALSGVVVGTLLCLVQEKYGIIKLGTGYIVDAYPVATDGWDILLVFATVLLMGFLAALYPAKYIATKNSVKTT